MSLVVGLPLHSSLAHSLDTQAGPPGTQTWKVHLQEGVDYLKDRDVVNGVVLRLVVYPW